MTTTIACPRCGTANTEGAVYCSSCGNGLRAPGDRTTTEWVGRGTPAPDGAGILERLRHATIGDYDVAVELGRGGMAAVYLAHDLKLDRQVAIKVMLPELTAGEEMVERFRREARTAGNLSHPHIIPIYHVRDEDGMVFFVMKFVEGRSLDSIVHEMGQLPIKMVETILSQTAGALAYAHRKNVIHRDIKPANIMLDEDGWAVLTDFGIAKVIDAPMLTTTGSTMGTPYYMSPEQCSSKPVTGASDQYSLGVTIYELLTGQPPFKGQSLMEIMSGHFFTTPASIRESRPDCPAVLEEIVMRMLEKDAEDRYAHLDEVVSALKAPTLTHDDPIRTQMIDLAKSGAKLRARVSIPISPVPLSRPSGAAGRRPSSGMGQRPVTAPRGTEPVPAPVRGSRRWFFALAASVVGVAATALFTLKSAPGILDPGAATVTQAPATVGAPAPAAVVTQPPSGGAVVPTTPPDSAPAAAAVSKAPVRQTPAVTKPKPVARPTVPVSKRDTVFLRDTLRLPVVGTAPGSTDPATTNPPPPVAPVDTMGSVLIGSRTPNAYLYVNDVIRGPIGTPRALPLRAGTVRLSVGAEGCTSWESTVTVIAGQRLQLGYKTLTCGPPQPR